MNLVETARISTRALSANKVRAALTMLGVIIGVSSVILLVSIGNGVRNDVVGQLEGLGSNVLWVMPGNMEESMSGGGMGMPPMGSSKQFATEDVELLRSRVPGVDVVPVIETNARVTVGSNEIGSSLMATDGGVELVVTSDLAEGRYFSTSEVTAAARVIILGADIATDLFPSQSAIGKMVSLEGQKFTVIGVSEKVGGGLAGGSVDRRNVIPVTTAQQVLGTKDITYLAVGVADAESIQMVKNQVRQTLRPKFGSDFSIIAQEQMLGILGTLLDTLTYMLAGIAAISLLVGGIGIMNIMLVSVTERTREIGIRKAVGARTYDVLGQFVIEAIMLSVSGGVIGILLGAAGAWLLSPIVPAAVTGWSVALAFMFSAGVGVFFGVYPAWKASRLDPIQALRYE